MSISKEHRGKGMTMKYSERVAQSNARIEAARAKDQAAAKPVEQTSTYNAKHRANG